MISRIIILVQVCQYLMLRNRPKPDWARSPRTDGFTSPQKSMARHLLIRWDRVDSTVMWWNKRKKPWLGLIPSHSLFSYNIEQMVDRDWCSVRVSSEDLCSTTIPKPRGIVRCACSGTHNLWKLQRAEPPRCPALRTRLKAHLSLWNSLTLELKKCL